MKRFIKILRNTILILVGLVLIAVVFIYIASSSRLHRQYPLPPLKPEIVVSEDSAILTRGRHLSIVTNCNLCHGNDMGGQIYHSGALGVIAGPNLTSGAGGIGNMYTNDDWLRALRHGVREDGTSMLVMPSEVFNSMSTEDLSALVSYLKKLPPVDRTMPETGLSFMGRALLVAGKLPVLVAEKIEKQGITYPATNPADSIQLGQYLTGVYSCRSCHGANFAGRKMGLPGAPPSTNLTPANMLHWKKDEFVKTLRTGIKRDGSVIHEVMPWQNATQLTDQELDAMWSYLSTVPPVKSDPEK
jgi:mono/diheme cytochrome c family protein